MKPETLKLPEENIGNTQQNIDGGKDFLCWNPFAQELKSTIDKWDLIKLKTNFYTAKETINNLFM